MTPLKILMVTSEIAPLAKTGGLADMVAGLSRALVQTGYDVRVLFPGYAVVAKQGPTVLSSVPLAEMGATQDHPTAVEEIRTESQVGASQWEPRLFAIRHQGYFGRSGLYQEGGADYGDNLERFAYFCRACVEVLNMWRQAEGWIPDVIHCHDWQASLVPVYLKESHATHPQAHLPQIVLTLHNLGYQGIFPGEQFRSLGLPGRYFTPDMMEFFGSVNLLKGGIVSADYLTTVSPTYCKEIQSAEYGFGLEPVLAARKERLVGIVNGIDTDVWNPMTDPWLSANYSVQVPQGKANCKAELQRICGLPIRDVPLLAVVSRLVSQKGIDLVVEAAVKFLHDDVQLVVLGTGEPHLEAQLRDLAQEHSQRVKTFISFDEGLAHRVVAGADLFLVPSRYEPCGLTQLYSLRYGAIPVVRRTGGLADTVIGLSSTETGMSRATGFLFEEVSGEALLRAIESAVRMFSENRRRWDALILEGMQTEVGWLPSANKYGEIYRMLAEEV